MLTIMHCGSFISIRSIIKRTLCTDNWDFTEKIIKLHNPLSRIPIWVTIKYSWTYKGIMPKIEKKRGFLGGDFPNI